LVTRLLLALSFGLGFATALVFDVSRGRTVELSDDAVVHDVVQAAVLVSTTTPTVTPTRRPMPTRTPTPTVTQTPIILSVGTIARVVVANNGIIGAVQTLNYGGEGMTITSEISGNLQIDFAPGTWINHQSSKLCRFVPMMEGIEQGGLSGSILSLTENADGSGSILVNSGGSPPISLIAVSADC
jgi:hypothetical protein